MRKTKEEAENTKTEILDSATKLFAEKGYFNTSLEDVAQSAGVTRGAVYWHFKNKTEIFEALFERLHKPFVEMILQDIQQDHPKPLEQIQTLCSSMLLDVEANAQKRLTLTLFMIKCDYSGELEPYKEIHLKQKQEKSKLFEQYFVRAKEKGQLGKHSDPELLTMALCCYMKGILVEYLNDPARFDIKMRAPGLIDLFFTRIVQ